MSSRAAVQRRNYNYISFANLCTDPINLLTDEQLWMRGSCIGTCGRRKQNTVRLHTEAADLRTTGDVAKGHPDHYKCLLQLIRHTNGEMSKGNAEEKAKSEEMTRQSSTSVNTCASECCMPLEHWFFCDSPLKED